MSIVDRLESIKTAISESALKSGRTASEITLLVVSKTWPAADLEPLIAHGHTAFGENRVQEAEEKIPKLPSHLAWHLIGHLQKNKARKALRLFSTIHSVDSFALAEQLNRIAAELNVRPQIYFQVNVANEARKHGFQVDAFREMFPDLLGLENLRIQGLMVIPPFDESLEQTRGHFRTLRHLRDDLENQHKVSLPGLSMGMTHDFPIAIEEGATIVRVGSAIFGHRA